MKQKRLLALVGSMCLVLVLASLPFMGACAKPAPAPVPAPPPVEPEEPAPPEVIELIFTHTVPAVTGLGQGYARWMDRIEEESGGRVKFVRYWANSLLGPREIFRGVLDGRSDVSYWVPNIELGLMPLNVFAWLPLMGWPSETAAATIYTELLNKFPQLMAEYQGLIVYAPAFMTPIHIHTTGKEVRVPADLKGFKICPANEELAQMVATAGGAPVSLVVADWYTSLERGVVDGFINVWGAIHAFKVNELMPYHAIVGEGGLGMTPQVTLINPDSWNRLPPDIQQLFKDLEPFLVEQATWGVTAAGEDPAIKAAQEWGHTITTLTPEEIQLWANLAQPLHDDWIAKNEAKGAKEIYEEAQRLIREYTGK